MIVRDAVWIGVGQAIVVCAGLASTRILTTLLPPEVYGQISLVVGLGTLSTGLFCLPFLQAALRSFPDAQLAGQIGALRRLARVYVQRGVLVAGLLLALGGLAGCSGQSGLSPREFSGGGGTGGCGCLAVFRVRPAQRSTATTGLRFAHRVGRPGTATRRRPAHLVAGTVLSVCAAGFCAGLCHPLPAAPEKHRGRHRPVRVPRRSPWMLSHRSTFLSYALPLMPMAAMNWVMSMGDRYVLGVYWSIEVVGLYWAAYALGSQPFIAATGLLHTTLRPILFAAVVQNDLARSSARCGCCSS